MKIALINGSPKFKDSNSSNYVHLAKEFLTEETIEEFTCNRNKLEIQQMDHILNSDAILFVFPLYIDSIPSHLLRCLIQMQEYLQEKPVSAKPMVYAIVNNGFFDGKQNMLAVESIKHWSDACGFCFGQGIGFGGGGMSGTLLKYSGEHGPSKNVTLATKALCENLKQGKSAENISTEPNFPDFAYKLAAESEWRSKAKKFGNKTRDLGRRL